LLLDQIISEWRSIWDILMANCKNCIGIVRFDRFL
jgi:hypothetical protein